MPDSVLAEADEVVLIDLTPEALLDRLRAGKIYPGAQIEAALQNFFRIENLAALREVALRQVAQNVESKRLVREFVGTREDRVLGGTAPQAVGERLLALVKPHPRGQRVVRRAWRSAQRLGANLDLLWVKPPGRVSAETKEQLDAMRRLASVLGARLIVEEGDDVVEVVKLVAEERGTTYVLMGTPRRRGLLGRLRDPLPERLVEALPGLDVRIVADRTLREGEEDEDRREREP
jgi:two-component system sensor histidine kinase KdpD